MGSQILSILRQGIWASLTGGWYYDPRQTHAANVFHLYIWLVLLCLPIVTQLVISIASNGTFGYGGHVGYAIGSHAVFLWTLYVIIVAVIFVGVKLGNLYLHRVFDSGECIVEESSAEEVEDNENSNQRVVEETTTARRRPSDRGGEEGVATAWYELLAMNDSTREGEEEGTHRDDTTGESATATGGPPPTTSSTGSSSGPPPHILARILRNPGTHLSSSHDDTSAGAVHCYRDEFGNWLTYTFAGDEGQSQGQDVPASGEATSGGDTTVTPKSPSSSSSPKSSPSSTMLYVRGQSTTTMSLMTDNLVTDETKKVPPGDKFTAKSTEVHPSKTTVSLEVHPRSHGASSSSESLSSAKSGFGEHNTPVVPKEQHEDEEEEDNSNEKTSLLPHPESQSLATSSPIKETATTSPEGLVVEDEPFPPMEVSYSLSSQASTTTTICEESLPHLDDQIKKSPEEDPLLSDPSESPPPPPPPPPPPIIPVEVVSRHSTASSSSSSSHSLTSSLMMPSRIHVIHSPLDRHHQLSVSGDEDDDLDSTSRREGRTTDKRTDGSLSDVIVASSSSRQPSVIRRLASNDSSLFQSILHPVASSASSFSPIRGSIGPPTTSIGGGSSRLGHRFRMERVPSFLMPDPHHSASSHHFMSHNFHQFNLSHPSSHGIQDMSLLSGFSRSGHSFPVGHSFPLGDSFHSPDSTMMAVPKSRQYYKLWLPCPFLKWTYVKVRWDRLQLVALLDHNLTTFELVSSIILGILVAILSSVIISKGDIFRDVPFFLFSFVLCSCQYTLLKSVQPDASSPTHGYNRIVVYSRPVYFCLTSVVILICHYILRNYQSSDLPMFSFFSLDIPMFQLVTTAYESSRLFLLSFPLIFTLGLLPQVDTFSIYFIEQLDIHVFGGTAATTGLISALFSFSRSVLTMILLYIFAVISLHRVFYSAKNFRGSFTYYDYNVLFSIYCAVMVSLSYLLSRSSSDPTVLFRLTRKGWSWIKASFSISCTKRWKTKKQLKLTGTRTDIAVEEEAIGERVEMKEINQPKEQPPQHASTEGQHKHEDPNSTHSDQQRGAVGGVDGEVKTPTMSSYLSSDDGSGESKGSSGGYKDPLPDILEETLKIRLQNDMITCVVVTIIVFAVHVSNIFTLQPVVERILASLAILWGLLGHYFIKQGRKELPWQCLSRPLFKSREWEMFEVKGEAKVMCFEVVQAWMWLLEKNVIFPLLFLSAITKDTPILMERFGVWIGCLVLVITSFKAVRSTFNDSSHNYIVLIFTYLLFEYDLKTHREVFLINYFLATLAYTKISELLLKLKFVLTYVAPWQITWGSAFHAFAQPFSVPHSGMLMIQAVISSILSSPLQPLLGSAIFLTSYVRPIKFWERDYNTKRVDHSNLRLASQLERSQLGSDDNNLNSIFYEHLTRSLQTSLYGDLMLGRWGQVSQGDCFILASDNLNCLVHIIELGNGLVTFQVRGLEFRGTYCQQREVEALSEGVSEDDGCCCCEPGHLPGMLSLNAAFNQRWLAWEVTQSKYVLEGYAITDNSAVSMLQPYDLRKALITYYVKSVIFYTIVNRRLESWISHKGIIESLAHLNDPSFVDLDPTFNLSVDEDFDYRSSGITRTNFLRVYREWILFCLEQRMVMKEQRRKGLHQQCPSSGQKDDHHHHHLNEEKVTTLCFALSLIARRSLSTASHNNSFTSVEFLLYGLHALFKGDFRITSSRDEWVFQDVELLKQVVAPAVRMAVKLHQDHFTSTDDYDSPAFLYASIVNYEKNIVISHEADPVWRNAVLSNVPSLLALRHVYDEGTDRYKFVMLNRRYLSFRVIKVNKECVRGLWAGQQQELIFLRNRNPERGSIQNAKQALRNIINSSCDQPIGYPIYVSPLTTSFAETNHQLCRVIGRPLSFSMFKIAAGRWWTRTKVRFGQAGCPAGIQQDDNLSLRQEVHPTTSMGGHGGVTGSLRSQQHLQYHFGHHSHPQDFPPPHVTSGHQSSPFDRSHVGRRSYDSRCSDRSFRVEGSSSSRRFHHPRSVDREHHRHHRDDRFHRDRGEASVGTPLLLQQQSSTTTGHSSLSSTSGRRERASSGHRHHRRRNSSSSNNSMTTNGPPITKTTTTDPVQASVEVEMGTSGNPHVVTTHRTLSFTGEDQQPGVSGTRHRSSKGGTDTVSNL